MMDLTVISRRLAEADLTEISALALRLSETLGATTQISRRIISDLRPVMIRELGLVDALTAYCVQFEQTTSIQCAYAFPAQLPPIVEEASIALFRIVQESLSNIVKYATASKVRLSLTVTEDFLELSVEDDGTGMGAAARGHGLLGIRERAEAFGGVLRVAQGLHGRGTGVFVTLALAQIAIPPNDPSSAMSAPIAIAR
jgi:signal transduction histidine kinase